MKRAAIAAALFYVNGLFVFVANCYKHIVYL